MGDDVANVEGIQRDSWRVSLLQLCGLRVDLFTAT